MKNQMGKPIENDMKTRGLWGVYRLYGVDVTCLCFVRSRGIMPERGTSISGLGFRAVSK